MKHRYTVLLAALVIVCGLGPIYSQVIPIEDLFSQPERSRVRISPLGKYFSYCAVVDGVPELFIENRVTAQVQQVTTGRTRPVGSYFWRFDEQAILCIDDTNGDENWHLKSVDYTSGLVRDLTPFKGVQVRIVSYVPTNPKTILIAMNIDDRAIFDLYQLDLETAELTLILKNTCNIQRFLTDRDGVLRGYTCISQHDGSEQVFVFSQEQTIHLLNWDMDESLSSGVIQFSKDGSSVYAYDCRGVDKTRLVKINIKTGDTEVLAYSEEAEVASAFFWYDTDDLWAVILSRDENNFFITNDEYLSHYNLLSSLHDGDPIIVGVTLDRRWWMVCFLPDDASPAYYVYDSSERIASYICDSKPVLNKYKYGKTKPISFSARDGLLIRGYLTQPHGVTEPANLPLVVLVHGGPWTRDTKGFDAEVQFLASRGYAVLQVNYRGSTGFGKSFVVAGDKQWGKAMQNDLTDAASWAIEQGIADPSRIAIMGGSYGGYAALAGAAFTPDLYRCAVDMCGPSNLVSFLNSIPPYWKIFQLMNDKRIGNVEKDREDLISRSPLFFVNAIKIPVLIAQGQHDPRVVKAESDQMVAALVSHEVPVQYLVFEDEGHGLVRAENRYRFYAAVEKFFARYL